MVRFAFKKVSLKINAICIFLLLSSLTFGFASHCVAQEDISLAPLNSAFLKYLEDVRLGKVQRFTAEGYALGFIPPPLDLSHMRGAPFFQPHEPLSFPSFYDLRTLGKVTPVKDQGPCGSCWAFATYGSLESYLLPSETWDFSENNLKNTHGFDLGHCESGNELMSTAYLSRWSGPIRKSDDPYNPNSNISPPGLPEQKHVQDVLYFVSRLVDPLDNDDIKQALMTYGAVHTSMYWWGSTYWNEANNAYYYNGGEFVDPNHAVAIVGWDDNFPRTKFNPPYPPGNGAFIIKNSWGQNFGENGYFYISYYDYWIGAYNALFTAQATTNYTTAYQYDWLGWVGSCGYYGKDTAWFANIFKATSDDAVAAVSFYVASPNSAYELYIYKGVTPGQPTSGSLSGTKTGTTSSAGYHSVPLDSPIPLTSGENFSVVVKLTTPWYFYPIPIEEPISGYTSAATANAGESYMSSNGISWTDITNILPNTNVCLKAFAKTTFPPAKIGVFRNGAWYLDLNGNGGWDGCATDGCIAFGMSGDKAVVGNWNGIDGSIGVFRNGVWFLDWNGNDGWDGIAIDKAYNFGLSTDIPVAGDWDGDGFDEIGVFRNGTWYLDYNGNGAWDGCSVDKCYSFDMTGDMAVVGDWNGDGKTEIGVKRGTAWYLDYNGNGTWDNCSTDRCYTFGLSTDLPISGDWDGDGFDKIGVFRNGGWYLDKDGSGSWSGCATDGCYTFGMTEDQPVAGRW